MRVVYNRDTIDFCGLKNHEEGFKCDSTRFINTLDRLSNHNYKKECGMHLKHKIPELKNADKSNWISNIILCALCALTLIFGVVGWFVRKRYKHLTQLIETELGSSDKKNN